MGSSLQSVGKRLSNLERKRFKTGGATPATTFSTSSVSTSTPWPALDILVGVSGILVIYIVGWASTVIPAGSSQLFPNLNVGYVLDGVASMVVRQYPVYTEGGSAQTEWQQIQAAAPVLGLAEGSHTVQLAIQGDGVTTYTYQQMGIACLPV